MNRKNTGFTLVEILIVVIILGILAAIVIPQFTEASQDARTSALTSDLQTLRSQIELFRVQHLDKYPCDASIADLDGAAFVAQLTSKTDNAGGSIGTGNLGPYMMKMPKNPFVPDAVSQTVTVGASATVPGDNSSGWYVNQATGKISPNDNGTSGTTAHKDL